MEQGSSKYFIVLQVCTSQSHVNLLLLYKSLGFRWDHQKCWDDPIPESWNCFMAHPSSRLQVSAAILEPPWSRQSSCLASLGISASIGNAGWIPSTCAMFLDIKCLLQSHVFEHICPSWWHCVTRLWTFGKESLAGGTGSLVTGEGAIWGLSPNPAFWSIKMRPGSHISLSL